MKRRRSKYHGLGCTTCGKPAARMWKTDPACMSCYNRALRGGVFKVFGGLGAELREKRRKKVKALKKTHSVWEIARKLKIDPRTVEKDLGG